MAWALAPRGSGEFNWASTHIAAMALVSSPCTRVCIVDPVTGICEGCGRTLEEIARWGLMSEAERRAIMADLDQRMRQARASPIEEANQA